MCVTYGFVGERMVSCEIVVDCDVARVVTELVLKVRNLEMRGDKCQLYDAAFRGVFLGAEGNKATPVVYRGSRKYEM